MINFYTNKDYSPEIKEIKNETRKSNYFSSEQKYIIKNKDDMKSEKENSQHSIDNTGIKIIDNLSEKANMNRANIADVNDMKNNLNKFLSDPKKKVASRTSSYNPYDSNTYDKTKFHSNGKYEIRSMHINNMQINNKNNLIDINNPKLKIKILDKKYDEKAAKDKNNINKIMASSYMSAIALCLLIATSVLISSEGFEEPMIVFLYSETANPFGED